MPDPSIHSMSHQIPYYRFLGFVAGFWAGPTYFVTLGGPCNNSDFKKKKKKKNYAGWLVMRR